MFDHFVNISNILINTHSFKPPFCKYMYDCSSSRLLVVLGSINKSSRLAVQGSKLAGGRNPGLPQISYK